MREEPLDPFLVRLKNMILNEAVEHGDFTLRSGKKSNYYLDLRKVTLSAYGAQLICLLLAERLLDVKFQALGGPCVGADPIVGAFLHQAADSFDPAMRDLRGFLVRGKEKEHGKAGRVIGSVLPGDEVVIVEDVITTGESVVEAIKQVQAYGCKPVKILSVVFRGNMDELPGAPFTICGVPFETLFTARDLGLT